MYDAIRDSRIGKHDIRSTECPSSGGGTEIVPEWKSSPSQRVIKADRESMSKQKECMRRKSHVEMWFETKNLVKIMLIVSVLSTDQSKCHVCVGYVVRCREWTDL